MFSCGDCDYQTKHKYYLKTHKLQHKSPKEIEMFSCDECSYQTKYKNDLGRHKLRHLKSYRDWDVASNVSLKNWNRLPDKINA